MIVYHDTVLAYHTKVSYLNHNLIQIYCSILLPCNVVTKIWSWDWNTSAPYGVVPYWDEVFYRVAISRMKIWRMPTLIMMKLPTQAAQPSKFSWDVNLQNRTLYTNEIEVMHERVFFCQKMKHFSQEKKEWRVTVLWRFSQNSVFKPWLPIL